MFLLLKHTPDACSDGIDHNRLHIYFFLSAEQHGLARALVAAQQADQLAPPAPQGRCLAASRSIPDLNTQLRNATMAPALEPSSSAANYQLLLQKPHWCCRRRKRRGRCAGTAWFIFLHSFQRELQTINRVLRR